MLDLEVVLQYSYTVSSSAGYGKADDSFRMDIRELESRISPSYAEGGRKVEVRTALCGLIGQLDHDKLMLKHRDLFDRYPGEPCHFTVTEDTLDELLSVFEAVRLIRKKDDLIIPQPRV